MTAGAAACSAADRIGCGNDRPSIPALVAYRSRRRTRRSHQRAGARLSLFGSLGQRSGGRRRRHDHAARRSVAAGAPRARRGLRRHRIRAADGGACARRRSAGRSRPGAATLAAVSRRRSGRGGRDRRAGAPGGDRQPRASALLGFRGASPRSAAPRPAWSCWKTRTPRLVPFSLDRIVGPLRPSGRHSRRPAGARAICRRRPARRWWSSCRRRWPISSPPATGWPPTARGGSPGRPARRPPSRSPPSRRRARCGRSIHHLRESGQLTAGLILRALLSGNVGLFEEALAELADVPLARVAGIVHDRRGAGFRALYDKAGLPASIFPAFREALDAMREDGFPDRAGRRQPAQAPHHRARADALRECDASTRSSRC